MNMNWIEGEPTANSGPWLVWNEQWHGVRLALRHVEDFDGVKIDSYSYVSYFPKEGFGIPSRDDSRPTH